MLHEELTDYVAGRLEAIAARFFPDWQLPAFFGGHRVDRNVVSDIVYSLGHLHQLGRREIGGRPIVSVMAALLRQVEGDSAVTFASYRIAEAILAFGRFEGNPVLAELTDAERENVRRATDTTKIYDAATDSLGGYPNNYWCVLARAESARQRLGILADATLLERAIGHAQRVLNANLLGYFDDDKSLAGRYDIYSPDVYLFLEPLWDRFDPAWLRQNLAKHVRLIELSAMENGACIAWGRSTGALSLCMAAEYHAAAVHFGLAADPGRSLGLTRLAFERFKADWMADDLISAHRDKHPYKYRAAHRLVQMTVDCLGKFLYTAKKLTPSPGTPGEGGSEGSVSPHALPGRGEEPSPYPLPEYRERDNIALFPPVDELIRFDEQGAGVWLFRNEKLAFQLPIVANPQADYVPWLHSPGLFEVPVDSDLVVGVPRVIVGDNVYTVSGRSAAIEKTPGGITLRYDRLVSTAKPHPTIPARCTIRYRIDRETVHGRIELELDQAPAGVGFDIAEAARPLVVRVGAGRQTVVDLAGSQSYRSFWGELRRWHQVDLPPRDQSLAFDFTIRPALRVTHVPVDHDYNRALFDAMPPGEVAERGWGNGTCYSRADVEHFVGDSEILHVGWPEHLVAAHGLSEEQHDRKIAEFLEKLAASGKKVVWTMHNRLPHYWPAERGRELYRRWARVADGVIHHSRWGMQRMLGELPYKPTAKHVVIPHGHYGDHMPRFDRRQLEAKYGLTPCAMRFGLLGRPQKEKQFDLIIRAFLAAGREDQQLVLTAGPNDPPPVVHPRVKVIVKDGMVPRAVVAEHNQLCDVLVSAHQGESYLTSGVPADAIGLALAMFVPDWEFFRETLGDAAVYHDNSEARLTELFRRFAPDQMHQKQAAMAALQPQYAWPRLAAQTLELYRAL